MKKWLFSLTILIFLQMPASHAYAGTINDNEAAVLEAAKGRFEVDGVTYRVDDSYLKQLAAYLGSDEVDLTAEQKDQLLVAVNSYVEAGVEGGYLIPVENQEKLDASETAEPSKDEATTKDQQDQSTNTKDEDIIEIDTKDENIKDTDTKDEDIKDTDTKDKIDKLDKDKESKDTKKANTENPTAPDTLSEEADLEAPTEGITTEVENQVGIKETDHIIKNTGFNLNRTFTIIGGLGILMLISMFVTIKYKFIAQSDE